MKIAALVLFSMLAAGGAGAVEQARSSRVVNAVKYARTAGENLKAIVESFQPKIQTGGIPGMDGKSLGLNQTKVIVTKDANGKIVKESMIQPEIQFDEKIKMDALASIKSSVKLIGKSRAIMEAAANDGDAGVGDALVEIDGEFGQSENSLKMIQDRLPTGYIDIVRPAAKALKTVLSARQTCADLKKDLDEGRLPVKSDPLDAFGNSPGGPTSPSASQEVRTGQSSKKTGD